MKTSRAWSGHNSKGELTQFAESASGNWFERSYCWNGYGMAMSKWYSSEKPTFRTMAENRYSGEISIIDNDFVIEHGFSKLYKMVSANFRLPA